MTKNVRVRPTSSYSVAKGKGDESEVAHKFGAVGAGTGDNDDDDRKYNAEQLLELNIIREAQKDKRRQDEERKLKEAEIAEKKRKQKA